MGARTNGRESTEGRFGVEEEEKGERRKKEEEEEEGKNALFTLCAVLGYTMWGFAVLNSQIKSTFLQGLTTKAKLRNLQ